MYRRRTRGSQKYMLKIERWRAAQDQRRMEGPAPKYPYEPPDIRRRIIVENYDFDRVTRHEFVLLKSDRIDCYRVAVDGKLLQGRMGWSKILSELVRKAFLRVIRINI